MAASDINIGLDGYGFGGESRGNNYGMQSYQPPGLMDNMLTGAQTGLAAMSALNAYKNRNVTRDRLQMDRTLGMANYAAQAKQYNVGAEGRASLASQLYGNKYGTAEYDADFARRAAESKIADTINL